jgi:hypothetical protein
MDSAGSLRNSSRKAAVEIWPFLQRRAVANVAGGFGRVFGQTKFLVRAFAERPHDLLLAAAGSLGCAVDVHGGMGQVHRAAGQALARRIKDVAVALLDGRGDFHFGFCSSSRTLRCWWSASSAMRSGLMSSPSASRRTTFLRISSMRVSSATTKPDGCATRANQHRRCPCARKCGDDFGDGVHRRADGNAVIGHDGETRAAIAEVVIHFAGRGGNGTVSKMSRWCRRIWF